MMRRSERRSRRGGLTVLLLSPRLDQETLAVCSHHDSQGRLVSSRIPQRPRVTKLTQTRSVPSVRESFERLSEVGLDLGHFEQVVGDLESLEIAYDAGHFLFVETGEGQSRAKERDERDQNEPDSDRS